jgi:hypothetical protein
MSELQYIPHSPGVCAPSAEPQPVHGTVTLYHSVGPGDAAKIQATGFQPGRRGLFAYRRIMRHRVWFDCEPMGVACVAVRFPAAVAAANFDNERSGWAIPADVADYWLFMQ